MSRIVSLHIDTWGGKFIVVGEFETVSQIPPNEFLTYGEALHELAKIAQREALMYEFSHHRDVSGTPDRHEL